MKIISRKLMLILIVICVVSGMLLLMPGALNASVVGTFLESITVTPDASIHVGNTQQFLATGHYHTYNGGLTESNLDITASVVWGSSSTTIATIVSNTGLATGVLVGGPIDITATQGAISGHAHLTVTAAPVTYPLNVVANNSIWGTTTGSGSYMGGAFAPITATPLPGYHFVSWTSPIGFITNQFAASSMYTMPSAAATVTANFAPDLAPYPLTMGVEPSGGGIITGAGAYSAGTKVDITATPNSGYKFIGWEKILGIGGDFDDAGSAITKFTMPASIASIKANFEWIGYSMSYNGNGYTNGSVPAGENFYAEGLTVPVFENTGGLVRDGFNFAGWNSAADGSSMGLNFPVSSLPSSFSMPSLNIVLYAQWTPVEIPITPVTVYTITKSVVGNGSITDPVPVVFNISAGSGQTYTIVPGEGQSIVDVLVNGISVGAVSSYTFAGVNSNQTIQAIFGQISVLALTEESITEEAPPAVIEVKGISNELPMTGQSMLTGIFGTFLILAGIMLGVIYRKKTAVK